MKPQSAVRITPMTNPHSRSAKNEGRTNKQAAEMEEALERIKEKAKIEVAESRKPKMLRKKANLQTVPEATGFAGPQKNVEEPENESPAQTIPGKVFFSNLCKI